MPNSKWDGLHRHPVGKRPRVSEPIKKESLPEPDNEDEPEFVFCDKCDGHPACEDFGCAYDLGLGRMVRKNIPPGTDDWG